VTCGSPRTTDRSAPRSWGAPSPGRRPWSRCSATGSTPLYSPRPAAACGSWRTRPSATTTSTSEPSPGTERWSPNTPGVLTDATADLTLALLLAGTRRVAEGDRLVRSGAAWTWDVSFMLGTGLQDKRLGVIGMGHIGRAVARRAAAFGMEIVNSSRRDSRPEALSLPVGLDELLETSDVVSVHCPLTSQTRHLIDAVALEHMKPSAFLINTARGAVVDEAALAQALSTGTIAGAGLDVTRTSPMCIPGCAHSTTWCSPPTSVPRRWRLARAWRSSRRTTSLPSCAAGTRSRRSRCRDADRPRRLRQAPSPRRTGRRRCQSAASLAVRMRGAGNSLRRSAQGALAPSGPGGEAAAEGTGPSHLCGVARWGGECAGSFHRTSSLS
jgi:hypothetical protein